MVLQLGSKGQIVARLQSALGIPPDGVFGKTTEAAVKKFQQNNGLVVDGIVGRKTFEVLGILSSNVPKEIRKSKIITDAKSLPLSNQTSTDSNGIEQFFLPKDEYFLSSPKQWVFLHYTASGSDPYKVINDWARDSRGRVGTEFVVGGQSIKGQKEHDGKILQAFPSEAYGWHLGIGNNKLHRNSIGIEVCSMGFLYKGGFFQSVKSPNGNTHRKWVEAKKNTFYTYVGTEVDSNQVQILSTPHFQFNAWHKISIAQIEATFKILKLVESRNGIPIKQGLPKLIEKLGVSAFERRMLSEVNNTKGTWSHSNVSTQKVDIFPQPELVEMLLSL
jgi:hypothetical protein